MQHVPGPTLSLLQVAKREHAPRYEALTWETVSEARHIAYVYARDHRRADARSVAVSRRAARCIKCTTIGCVGLLAQIAGTVSYLHMRLLVELHGQPGWVAARSWRRAVRHRRRADQGRSLVPVREDPDRNQHCAVLAGLALKPRPVGATTVTRMGVSAGPVQSQ
jgi:hypothetical protein